MGKKGLFLTILVIASLEMTATMVNGGLLCNTPWLGCLLKCFKGTGRCMRCCQGNGFVHGRCDLIRDDLCFCCKNVDDPPAVAAGRHDQHPGANSSLSLEDRTGKLDMLTR
uniref:Uncharacterized protein n=1 Tax=Avena sativa TaxID=4498 RepID=A0ACD5ZM14_AVESA